MHLGIDFGTCFTSAAVLTGNQFRYVQDRSGGVGLPFYASAAYLTPEGQLLLGALAKSSARRDPMRFRQEFKRDLGSQTPYLLGDQEFLPQDLIARLLARMKEEAEKVQGTPIRAAVLTVPASYDAYRRNLMRQAGVAAGFRADGLALLDEPEAAALAYDWQLRQQGRSIPEGAVVLVYDLGGGTFDAALMRKEGERFRSLAPPVGDPYCGGIDFDRAIYEAIQESAEEELQTLLSADDHSLPSLRTKVQIADFCRDVKHRLSELPHYDDLLPTASAEEFQISQEAFAEKIAPYVERTVRLCEELLALADCTAERVDGVLLVGGSSRIPSVTAHLTQTFGRPLWHLDDPQLAVCMGAAILPAQQRVLKSVSPERVARVNPILLSCGQEGIAFWDTSTGELVRSLTESTHVSEVALSREGKPVASRSGYSVLFWDAATARPILSAHHKGVVTDISLHPDGIRVASASHDKTVRVWDTATGDLLHKIESDYRMESVAFSPDGKTLASAGHSALSLHDTETGNRIEGYGIAAKAAGALVYRPDGSGVALAVNKQIYLWNFAVSRHTRDLIGHTGPVSSIAFSPDGKLLASGSGYPDFCVKLWDVESVALIRTLSGFSADVQVAFSSDGKTIAGGSSGGTIKLWNVSTGELLHTLQGSPVSALVFSPDNSAGMATAEGHAGRVTSLAIDATGNMAASGGSDQTIHLWDLETGSILQTISCTAGEVSGLAFLPGQNRLVAADTKLSFWNTALQNPESALPPFGPTSGIRALAASPDSRYLATANKEALLCLWDAASQELSHVFHGHRDAVNSVVFAPDGALVISGSADRTVRIWSIAENRLIAVLEGHDAGILSIAVTSDGLTMASADQAGSIRLWDREAGQTIHMLSGHEGAVHSVAFSADGSTLVSAGADSTVRLWNVATGDRIDTLQGHEGAVNAALLAGDDTARLITCGDDRSVRFWKLEWA